MSSSIFTSASLSIPTSTAIVAAAATAISSMATETDPGAAPVPEHVSVWRWLLGFLLVGCAWGLTTPFMRRAALHAPPSTSHPALSRPNLSPISRLILKAWFGVTDTLRRPAYAIPFLINVTGSVWFFLLIGKAELSLTVPITNSCAFLFTVLGEWWAEGKKVDRNTWIGMALVLTGIGLCVQSKV